MIAPNHLSIKLHFDTELCLHIGKWCMLTEEKKRKKWVWSDLGTKHTAIYIALWLESLHTQVGWLGMKWLGYKVTNVQFSSMYTRSHTEHALSFVKWSMFNHGVYLHGSIALSKMNFSLYYSDSKNDEKYIVLYLIDLVFNVLFSRRNIIVGRGYF